MKRTIVAVMLVVLILGTGVVAFAAAYNTPAEAVAGLTGKSVESVIELRKETGKTYGTIALEAGKLEEYKNEILAIKKEQLAKLVESGRITKERADEIIKALEEAQLNCDGTGSKGIGKALGAGFGFCRGEGYGMGLGNGKGQGLGRGAGSSNGNGRGCRGF